MIKTMWVGTMCLAAACSASDDGLRTTRTLVGTNGVGVGSIEIERSNPNGEKLLMIHGFDTADRELATLSLRTGMVNYSWDPAVLAPEPHLGTELTIHVDGIGTGVEISPILQPHVMSISEFRVKPFAAIPEVAAELQLEAGITVPQHAAGETAYGYEWVATCDAAGSGVFQTNKGIDHCCLTVDDQEGYWTMQISTGGNHASRGSSWGHEGCTDWLGNHNCSGTDCVYGPCGAHLIGPISGSLTPEVFDGWDDTYGPIQYCDMYDSGGTPSSDYFGGDSVSSGFGTCPYTGCSYGSPY